MLFVLSAALTIAPAAADDPDYCDGEIIQVGLGDATPYGTYYYVIVGETPDAAYGYVEANDIAGLQRGVFFNAGWTHGDPCYQSDNSDFQWY